MPSRFDKDTIREYFEHCQRAGKKRIGSIPALTDHAHKTASNDEEIREWLFPPDAIKTVPCPACNGTGRVEISEETCYMCKGARQVSRFNPATDEDELWPCPACQETEFDEQVKVRGLVRAPVIEFAHEKSVVSFRDVLLVTNNEGETL